ncbi:Uu.00g130630.m01.CDS01 [Anthostomella pinea]|uniref:Uu.00g130630.m01.CDS01 n=1 Tax=Anthostomella pinea TaxID=933095 RepID=A0AAI8YI66_9PEZI|nr:Uu.00g130630.m01.CDS01 [Anthostomella pinea]
MSSTHLLGLAVFLGGLSLLVYRLSGLGRRPGDYPPGPPTLPFIGNLLQMPKEKGHLQFEKWAKQYGPIYSLILGTQTLIVLSSEHAMKDLLERRGAIYSSRPDSYLAHDILSGGHRVVHMTYNKSLKLARKLARKVLDDSIIQSTFLAYQDLESRAMLLGFLETPEHFSNHLKRFTCSFTTQMVFGHRTPGSDDAFMKKLFYPCAAAMFAEVQESEGLSDDRMGYFAGSLLQAGSETTMATLLGFVQAMVIFPDVAQAAQAEIDRVCGDRLPSLDDWESLAYVRGCIKESLRWMPTAILGVPHSVDVEDRYMGYRFPKNASVIYNVWAIHNDPKRHPNPRNFDPTRWAGDNQNSYESARNEDVTQRDHYAFGMGRRMCLATNLVDQFLFLAISRLLWSFDFKRAIDEKTKQEIIPDMNDLAKGLFTMPSPFKANILPRYGARAQRIREDWSNASKELLDDGSQWKEIPVTPWKG